MSCFSTALTKVLATIGWSQRELADATHIKAPQVNRYTRGTSNIQTDGLRAILKAIPDGHRAELLAAYLKDAIPEEFSHLVTILTNDCRVKESKDDDDDFRLPEEADPELREIVKLLIRRAVARKEVRDMLKNFNDLMR